MSDTGCDGHIRLDVAIMCILFDAQLYSWGLLPLPLPLLLPPYKQGLPQHLALKWGSPSSPAPLGPRLCGHDPAEAAPGPLDGRRWIPQRP